MNNAVLFGQIRTALAAALAVWASKHVPPEAMAYLPEGWAELAVGILAAAPVAAWSWWSKRPVAGGQ